MRHSPQSPTGSVSSCSSPALLHPAWSPSDHNSTRTTTTTRPYNNDNNPPNNNNDDLIDDDIFGSAAWRKRHLTKRGGKTSGQDHSGQTDNKATKYGGNAQRQAVVRVLESGARGIKALMVVAWAWMETAWTWISSSAKPASAAAAVTAVPDSAARTTGCGPWKADVASEPGSYELTTEVLVQQARLLCGNYIYHRLCSKGLMCKRVHVAPYHSLVSEELCSAGQELERLYPRVYSDVSRRIAMTMSSAQLVRRMLTSVMEGTFKSGITWAKVVSMVVISSAFAEECVVQGHPNYVEDVVMCVGHFVMVHLTGWLVKQGGWAAFPTARPPMLQKSSDSSPALLRTALVLFGLAIVFLGLLKFLLGTAT